MTTDSRPLDALLDHLKRTRGFDFTGYKRASLERRIAVRMAAVGCDDHLSYLDYLEVHPEEFEHLFNTILINVTAFFRDAAAWQHLSEAVLPELLGARPGGSPIRVWCAGCASGQEAYSAAMVLAQALGPDQYRERVKIYATDVDEEALAEARQASYTAKQVETVPQELLERYFERADGRFAFHKDLRRTVIFGRNNLVQDAPISRVDLLLCRNTLMYFTAETQARILGRFQFALQDDGVLFLGKSEMLITHGELFRPIELQRRIFRKASRAGVRDRPFPQANGSNDARDGGALRETAFDAAPVAQIVLDGEGALAAANQEAQRLLALAPADIGRPFQDLELSYRPVELRSHLDEAAQQRRGLLLRGVPHGVPGGTSRLLDVRITPLRDGEVQVGSSVSYVDVTDAHRLQQELQRSKAELEGAYDELQSTVEELETTNEELQSTNEELETMNEELQSTNEELGRTNAELRRSTFDLDQNNALLEAILTTMGMGVAVLDDDLRVTGWNTQAGELWGVRSEEVTGEHLLTLDIGLPLEQLRAPIRDALAQRARQDLDVDATNRRGQAIRCHVTVLPLTVEGSGQAGCIVLMEDLGR